MAQTRTLQHEKKEAKRQKLPIIDCDVHNTMPSDTVLYPYLPQRWRRHHSMLGTPDRVGGYIPRAMPYGARYDAWPPSGQRPGSDLSFLQEQLLDFWNIEYGILNCFRTMEPLGRRKYWKMYEAAVRHDLPIGIHFTGVGSGPITAVGRPSHYIEDHTGMTQAFQTQVTSLVCEGVFEHFPTLKIVLIEGGIAWLPPLMWRLDHAWKKLREEVPYLKRLPSEYIREHFWLTTQPMDEPPKSEYLQQLLVHLNVDEKLMFATDYPHWDFDAPDRTIPTNLGPGLRRKIMAENARTFYQL